MEDFGGAVPHLLGRAVKESMSAVPYESTSCPGRRVEESPGIMTKLETSLPGVLILEPAIFTDARGLFYESYNQKTFADLEIHDVFVQDNHSTSVRGTVRGLHYQMDVAQSKLCRVVQGEVLDVAVDVRRGSPHFGQWVGVILSAENHRAIYIPRGFAHGFSTLSETSTLLYKCDAPYAPAAERGIAWDDPQLRIDWRIDRPPLVSPRDAANPRLAAIPAAELPEY